MIPNLRVRRNRFVFFATLCGIVAISLGEPVFATDAAPRSPRPNVVIIMADDMGYGDVQALNDASQIPTPHLNRLAGEGMAFTDAHTPSAVCTPTRYGLLTGRYCWRTRLTRGVLNGYGEPLIDATRATIATALNNVGYQCGIIGKWHLGLSFTKKSDSDDIDFAGPVRANPNDYGFDYSHIIPASLDFPPYVYIRNGRCTTSTVVSQSANTFPHFWREGPRAEELKFEECLDELLAEATSFIDRASMGDEPFFLYFPLTAPHKPTLPHERFRGNTALGPYGDFITQVDWTVGQVLAKLDETGTADDTIVIYTSDNGSYMYRRDDASARDHTDDETIQAYRADEHTANHIYRGTKADVWEAGHRVPFFVRWPGHIEAGSTCGATICLTDVFATIAHVVEAPLGDEDAPDSFSFYRLLEGRELREPREPVIHHSGNGMFAIRDGDWKLVAGNGSGGRQNPKGQPFERPYQLFNLSTDPRETTDLIKERPDVAKRLEAQLERIRQRTP